MDGLIVIPADLRERLLQTVAERHPAKSFGYLLSETDGHHPVDFVSFEHNIRNADGWRAEFEARGQYFRDHSDAGFVATPQESWRIQKEIRSRGLHEVAVFHSHQRHPANFSGIDYDLHLSRFTSLWHLIISMRNPTMPVIRAFDVSATGVREVEILAGSRLSRAEVLDRGAVAEDALGMLRVDQAGRPEVKNSRWVLEHIRDLVRADRSRAAEFLRGGLLRGADERYETHVADLMRHVPASQFTIGTGADCCHHFCGEVPGHEVELSPFAISSVPVTNALYALWDERRAGIPDEPVVDVSWYDALLFALWMGCDLPTEAQWEYACGGGSEHEWCCRSEEELPRYAWFGENAGAGLHSVATREPNSLGLFDMHGGVWEWCRDAYAADWYARSPRTDPLNRPGLNSGDRVTRGGSIHAVAEMCRTRYRMPEPAHYWAADLGFRLSRNVQSTGHGEMWL